MDEKVLVVCNFYSVYDVKYEFIETLFNGLSLVFGEQALFLNISLEQIESGQEMSSLCFYKNGTQIEELKWENEETENILFSLCKKHI